MPRLRHLGFACTLLGGATLLASCDTLSSSSGGNPIGIGVFATRSKGAGYTTAAEVAFYRVASATFVASSGVQDTCVDLAYSASGSPGTTTATALGAGAYLLVQIGNQKDSLTRTAGSTDPTYRSSFASGLSFTPGDSIVVTIPGERSGFPAVEVRGRTAEPFTMDSLVVPQSGSPITFHWTAATDGNAAMYVSLRYASGSSTDFNRQIACSFVDDGTGTITASVAQPFILATNRDRQPVAQRLRAIVTQVNVPLAYFNLVSEFDRPTPVSP